MELIPEWRRGWRMISVQCQVSAAALLTTWTAIPDEMRSSFDPGIVHNIAIALLVVGTVGRLVRQDSVSGEAKKDGE